MNKLLVKIAFFSVLAIPMFNACRKHPPAPPVVTTKDSTKTGTGSGIWIKHTYDPISNKPVDSVRMSDNAKYNLNISNLKVVINSENLGEIICQDPVLGIGYIEFSMPAQLSKFKHPNGSPLYWNLYDPTTKPKIYDGGKVVGFRIKLTTDLQGKMPVFADYRLEKF